MMKLSHRFALVAMMLMVAISAAWAQPGGDGRGEGRGDGMGPGPSPQQFERCLGTLDLSREQMAAIQQIKERLATAMEGYRAQMMELKQALMAAREAGNRERAAAIMEQIKTLEEQMATAHRNAHERILAVLTDAQRAALRDCLEAKLPPVRDDRGRSGDRRMDCFSKIGLSDEQMADIRELRAAFHTANQDLTQELRELHRQLREARRDGDRALYMRLRNAIAGKMEQLKAAQQRLHNAIMGILTEEQREALKDCNEDRPDHDRDGDDNGRGNGRGGLIRQGEAAPALK